MLRNATQFATKVAKKAVADSGVLSEEQAAAVESAANAVENQAKADPNTSLKDRVKMGGTSVVRMIWHTVFDCVVLHYSGRWCWCCWSWPKYSK